MNSVENKVQHAQTTLERFGENPNLDAQRAQEQVDQALQMLKIELGAAAVEATQAIETAITEMPAQALQTASNEIFKRPEKSISTQFSETGYEIARVAVAIPKAAIVFGLGEFGGVFFEIFPKGLFAFALVFALSNAQTAFLAAGAFGLYGAVKAVPRSLSNAREILAKPPHP